MHCDQIRPHLEQYRNGTLAPFRAAWVAQHLAGCALCAAALEDLRAPCPPSPARPSHTGSGPGAAKPASVAVQRSVPLWYRFGALTCLLALAGGVIWNLGYRERAQVPSAELLRHEGPRELLSEPIHVGAGDVLWILDSLQDTGGTGRLHYRVEGPPGRYLLPGLPLVKERGRELPVHEDRVYVAPGGMRGELAFDMPERPTGMLVSLPGLLRSEGDLAAIALDRRTRWEDPRGLMFHILAYGPIAGGYQVRVAVEGEDRWQIVPDLGVVLLDRGYRHEALSWIREEGGNVLRLWFGLPPSDFAPRILILPLAEKIDGSWTAWILLDQ